MDQQKWINAALNAGATKAAVIKTDSVVTNASFRDVCASNACGGYGRCWMCPPDVGEIGELMAQIREYSHGLLFQTIAEIEDSFDFEGMAEAGKHHAAVCRDVRAALKDFSGDILFLGAGGCRMCERCAKLDGLPCRKPGEAMPSMEAYGIDVYKTTEPTGLRYINGQNTVTYFGLALFNGED